VNIFFFGFGLLLGLLDGADGAADDAELAGFLKGNG